MKLIKTSKKQVLIELNAAEKFIIGELLGRYPILPPDHFKLSKCGDFEDMEEDEAFLHETLSDEQKANVKEIQRFLTDEKSVKQVGDNFQVTLKREQIEWLLQIVNDIRVGSWAMLGQPDELEEVDGIGDDPVKSSYAFAMEISTVVQSILLASLER